MFLDVVSCKIKIIGKFGITKCSFFTNFVRKIFSQFYPFTYIEEYYILVKNFMIPLISN